MVNIEDKEFIKEKQYETYIGLCEELKREPTLEELNKKWGLVYESLLSEAILEMRTRGGY